MTKLAEPIHVWARCPGCDHEWHAATLVPGAWWMAGTSEQVVLNQCYCVRCQHVPPMGLARRSDDCVQASIDFGDK